MIGPLLLLLMLLPATAVAPTTNDDLAELRSDARARINAGGRLVDLEPFILARRTAEDERLESADDPRLLIDAAMEPLVTDLRAGRAGASTMWGIAPAEERAFALESFKRTNALATAGWTDAMGGEDRAARTRRANAAGLRATAMLGVIRANARDDDWTNQLDDVEQLLDEAIDLGDHGRGLARQSAAIAAAANTELERARTDLDRARREPTGLDPLLLELLQASFDAGGITAKARLRAGEIVSRRQLDPSERLFLAEWLLRAGLESGLDRTEAGVALEPLLVNIDSTRRPALVRAVSDLFKHVPGEPGNHPLDQFSAARAAAAGADLDTAREMLAAVGRDAMSQLRPEAWLELANLELADGRVTEAETALLHAIRADPSHPSAIQAARIAVRLANRQPDPTTTIQTLVDALPTPPDRYARRMRLARAAMDRMAKDEAMTIWRGIPTRAPEAVEAKTRLVAGLIDLPARSRDADALPAALDALAAALDAHPDPLAAAKAKSLTIRALLAMERRLDAAQLAESIMDLRTVPPTERHDAVSAAIQAFRAGNRTEDIQRLLEELQSIDPAAYGAFLRRQLGEEASRIRRLLADNPSTAQAEAMALIRQGLVPRAADIADQLAEDPWLAVETAFLLRIAGEPEQALAIADLGLDAHPAATELLLERAEALANQDDPASREEAIVLFRRIRAGVPRRSQFWWRCELRQLELLVSLEAELDQVRARIRMLRQEDAELGGEVTRRGFESIQARLGDS